MLTCLVLSLLSVVSSHLVFGKQDANEEGTPEKTNIEKNQTLDENVEYLGDNDDDVVEVEKGEEKGRVIAIVDFSSDNDVDKEGEEHNIPLWQPWQGSFMK